MTNGTKGTGDGAVAKLTAAATGKTAQTSARFGIGAILAVLVMAKWPIEDPTTRDAAVAGITWVVMQASYVVSPIWGRVIKWAESLGG